MQSLSDVPINILIFPPSLCFAKLCGDNDVFNSRERREMCCGGASGVNGARMQDKCFPTLLVFLCRPRLRRGLWAGEAALMQPECRQMESDTCVCRMVFVVTL